MEICFFLVSFWVNFERKTQQNRQERRREKVKKSHESQMSELKRYVQNVRITIFKTIA